jgi:hypothetical protein
MLLEILVEHAEGTAETEYFQLRTNLSVRPVMENVREIVDIHAIPENIFFGSSSGVVTLAPA